MDTKGNIIIAVDFDGTLSFGRWPECGEPNERLFAVLKEQKAAGAKIILHTCRNGKDLTAAVEYCRAYGLEFDTVNENLPDVVEYYGGDTRKINADYYIDDRALNPVALFGKLFDFITKKEG